MTRTSPGDAARRSVSLKRNGCTSLPSDINQRAGLQPNRISTTRFTPVTWLPLSLFAQFQRAANIYFLVVSILVCLDWSPIRPSSTVIPFICVLLWTACKDLYEDVRRKRDDDRENMQMCWRFNFQAKQFIQVKWCDVLYGDVLLTLQDEALPSDVLLVRASGGQAYISTVNLDGETNLKERRAADALSAVTETSGDHQEFNLSKTCVLHRDTQVKQVMHQAEETLEKLSMQSAEVQLGEPRAMVGEMEGSIDLKTPTDEVQEQLKALKVSTPHPLTFENFIPRGCVLRNTAYVISIAAYVGGDTKTRLNMARTGAKVSNMQLYLNRGVQCLVLTLLIFCSYATVSAEIGGHGLPSYDDRIGSTPVPVARFVMYWVILYQVVPISLYVCFEMIKLILGFQINRDPQMVCPRTGKYALARTADLVEEMGQVNFVFSDKTGTLTENEMIFARCCIGGKDMGDFRPDKPQEATSSPSSNSGNGSGAIKVAEAKQGKGIDEVRTVLSRVEDPCHAEVRWFFFCLVTCHSGQVDFDDDGKPVFSGSSPDEVAFLEAAEAAGITFTTRRRLPGKSGWELHVKGPGDQSHIFTVLCEIPFTSERKRMTVVVEYRDELFCICKGADNVMGPICEEPFSASSLEHLTSYSKLGLRTLAWASKIVERSFFEGWIKRWTDATMQSEGREEALAVCAADMEHSLMLSGVSAIEDKLQQGVPEAITTIKAAGIRFWVLTGDKTETAVEIVRACQLFTEGMPLAYMVDCRDTPHALQLLEAAQKELENRSDSGLIIDGTFVRSVLLSESGSQLLYDLAIASRACVCCRLSPQQKRKLVELVKAKQGRNGITLAIGDGANDVSMIQGAHVGIGVRGKEGEQAVQASDVAISQFRFLVPLLMCHGRRAYRRMGIFLCYFLYKHIALAVGDMLWAHQDSQRFGGQIAYPDWMSAAYPGVLTALPVIVVLGFDRDLPDKVACASPELYIEGLRHIHFNAQIFVMWMLSAVWHGSIAWLVPSLWVGSNRTSDGQLPMEFWEASCVSFIMVTVFVNFRLWMWSLNPLSWWNLAVMTLSFSLLLICLFILGETSLGYQYQPDIDGVPTTIFSEPKYLTAMVVTPLFLLVDVAGLMAVAVFGPSPLDLARRRYRREGKKDAAQTK